jgi:sugar phosphate isomerase/epimerase
LGRSSQFKFDILDFIELLKPYLCHVHAHDNMGVPSVVNENLGDQHLPLGKGKIDYQRVFEALNGTSVKNVVLELLPSNTSKEEALRSIDTIRGYLKGSNFNWCATAASS